MKCFFFIIFQLVLVTFNCNLLSLSNFLNLFHNKNQSLTNSSQQIINFENIDPFYYLNNNDFSYEYDDSPVIYVSNKQYLNIQTYEFKHDLDYEAYCELKQAFILKLIKMEIEMHNNRKQNLKLFFEKVFLQINEKTISIFQNENPESLTASFNLNLVEFSPIKVFNNISCFGAHSKIVSNIKPNIFEIFCVEQEMLIIFNID